MYTVKQLEEIAETILSYETQGSYHAANDELPYTISSVMIEGVPSTNITWSLNIKLGINPADMKDEANFAYQHPLQFIAAFEDFPEVRDPFLRRIEDNVEGRRHDYNSMSVSQFLNPGVIPGPKDLSLRLTKATTTVFNVVHAAWYTPQALNKMAHDQMIYHYKKDISDWLSSVRAALEEANQPTDIFTSIATEIVLRALQKKANMNTDYDSLARAVAIGDQERLEEEIGPLTNIFSMLGVALQGPQPKTMVRALKTIATARHYSMLRHFGRPPTTLELLQSNVKGAAQVWRYMPWDILQPLVQEHGVQLRAALLKHTAMPYEELKEVLVDHAKRVKPIDRTAEVVALHTLDEPISWEAWKRGLMRYFAARRVREVLCKNYPKRVAQLIVLRHVTQRTDLASFVDGTLTEDARAALAAYESPIALITERRRHPCYKEIT